jgi:group I intron endonuclease
MNHIEIPRENGDIKIQLPTPTAYIYRFSSPSGKAYIGQTKDVPHRINQHLSGEGSKLLIPDLIEFGRKAFKIDIIEVLYTDQAHIDEREDYHIRTLDTLAPLGYNQRYNANIIPEEIPIDLNNIQITAKYTFKGKDGFNYFSIPRFTQCRAYQILANLGKKKNLTQKKLGGFDYYELKTPANAQLIPQKIYKLSLAYKHGFRIVECE